MYTVSSPSVVNDRICLIEYGWSCPISEAEDQTVSMSNCPWRHSHTSCVHANAPITRWLPEIVVSAPSVWMWVWMSEVHLSWHFQGCISQRPPLVLPESQINFLSPPFTCVHGIWIACKNYWGGWIPLEVSGKVCFLCPLTLRKVQQQEMQTPTYSSCAHTVCTNAYHTPLKSLMHRETLQSHWFIGSTYTCGLKELLTLLTAAEVKMGFKVPAKQDLAAHLRWVDWPELWNSVRAAYTPHTITHAPNDQCNWVESFYRCYCIL